MALLQHQYRNDEGHSEEQKRAIRALIRKQCAYARSHLANQDNIFKFLYNIYRNYDITKIPYYLKYQIKYIVELNSKILKFKSLITHREILISSILVDISIIIKMMMEFSVVLGFYYMPKTAFINYV
jgi:hypothetical protein